MRALLSWLRRRAENVLVLMILAMFVAFILQIVFRYFLNLPVAWTEEVCVLAWLWGILWGSAFVTRDEEQIRFDMVTSHVSTKVRRLFSAIAGTVFIVVMAIALPATWGYVNFMKVESSASLGIPFSWVFSAYLVFAVAMMVRQGHLVWQALRGDGPDRSAP
jgi:C4-dicarboxylate transporter DctQ subunit